MYNSFSEFFYPKQCGDVFPQLGISRPTPEYVREIACDLEKLAGDYSLDSDKIWMGAAALTGGLFLHQFISRGGPQAIYNRIRKQTPAELMGQVISFAVKNGLIELIPEKYLKPLSTINKIMTVIDKILDAMDIPDVVDKKAKDLNEQALKRLSAHTNASKKQEAPTGTLKDIKKTVTEKILPELILGYVKIHKKLIENADSEEKLHKIFKNLPQYLKTGQLNSPKSKSNLHIKA